MQSVATSTAGSPLHETRACAGFASFKCASRAGPTCGREGLGMGVVRRGNAGPNRTTPHPNPPPQGGRERTLRASGFVLLALAILLFTASHPLHAQDAVEAFYQGRQINLVVGYGPGGGYDLTARLLARHIGRFIPGRPSVAVQNMAGAGSLRAAHWLYEAAPKDGGTIGLFGSDIAMVA